MSYIWNKDAYTLRELQSADLKEVISILKLNTFESTQIQQKMKTKLDYYYLIEESGKAIGIISLNDMDTDLYAATLNVKFELEGGDLECKIWCIQRMMYLAFSVLKLHRLTWNIPASMQNMRELARTVGFKKEGMLRDAHRIDGVFSDLVLFSMLDHEWHQEEKEHQIW